MSLALGGLILFAIAIRIWLIFGSGQLLGMDGPEYFGNALAVYNQLSTHSWQDALSTPVYAHWGCILFGTLAFFLLPDWLNQQEMFALVFALPGIINILLLYGITLRLENNHRAALIAAALYTLSFSAIYHIRYVHPQELSMMFFMMGILVTLKKPQNTSATALSGLFQFMCFFVYYGYWILAFIGLLFSTIHGIQRKRDFVLSGGMASIGFFAPLIAFVVIGNHYGADYIGHFIGFSQSITMGDFNLGHIVPFAFFWNTEGFLFVLWCLCFLFSFHRANKTMQYCIAGISLIYGILVISSNLLGQFVVYGRIAKMMVPFFCVLSACILYRRTAWQQILILACIIPGYFVNALALKNATIMNDVYQQERIFRKTHGMTHDIVFYGSCTPHHERCGALPKQDCLLLWEFQPADQLAFNLYDSQTEDMRDFWRQHSAKGMLMACPKAK
ncbi:MAG: hypothetical protein EP312_05625 [Gammaproteobacteria bacterium]|nr:MAG: hypothetical protein EP312_05625 [Gammaproteobacteria bacterium]